MASTGEADRKRRHLSSISPTAASAMANKSPFSPLSEDRKLDTTVLQYQNQKVSQKLEVQKVEISALENKLSQGKEKQQPYEKILTAVNKSWNELVSDLEARSIHTKGLVRSGENIHISSVKEDGASSSSSDTFANRLVEIDSSETCLASDPLDRMIEDGDKACEKSRNILHNIVTAVDELWRMKDGLYAAVLMALPQDGSGRKKSSNDLAAEVKKLRSTLSDLHLKHRSLAGELRKHEDSEVKNKAELKYLQGDLESTVRELEESNSQLAALKAEKDATKGTFFPMLNMGTKPISNDREGDSKKDIQDMESALKDSMDQSSSRLQELKQLHEERIEILKKLSNLQGSLKNVKSISSSRAFMMVKEELEKTKADFRYYQALYEKLQVAKDRLLWKEREANVMNDLCDVHRRCSTSANSVLEELQTQIQQQIDERKLIQTKLETASGEPGRKEIISNFREFVSSFPEDMSAMQSKLRKYKETAADIHSLRAEVASLSNVLARKANELESLSSRSANQDAEIQRLQSVVRDLKEGEMELKLILEMYRHESTLPRDLLEVRDREFKAWAHVHSLKYSLDEHNMESRVKAAIEAEASSQQRLAAAEAEIACLREKSEFSLREKSRLSSVLKSKHEENEAYLSEIETIGQAYDDMQNQNQHLLQQITERDDYNIKLEQELLKGKQTTNSLQIKKQILEKKVQQATVSRDFLENKATRIEDQVKTYSDQVKKLAEDRCQNSVALENMKRKLSETRKANQHARESLEELQTRVKNSRTNYSDLQIELEKQRFEKRRVEEELEAVKRKAERLMKQKEGSAVEKLRRELQEYKEILKCTACLDRPKEVVITKCFHLLCNPCVQRAIDGRHRKCPVCSASFGPNDVKPVYI